MQKTQLIQNYRLRCGAFEFLILLIFLLGFQSRYQKHHISTCANEIVAQVKECVDEMKRVGVSNKNLTDWAMLLYKEITG
ncbi:MAG: hypothetical protein ACKPEQ_04325, partial [Dolichospermum sp.]